MKQNSLTEGGILSALLRFIIPVFFTLFLQSLYGGVDMLIVGRFADIGDASGVATGSMVMNTVTNAVSGIAVGITVILARSIGEEKRREAGRAVGAGVTLFLAIAAVLTIAIPLLADTFARVMRAPAEAYESTCDYIRICGLGSVFIVAYNVLGSVFRGIGDSKTPLVTVAIASVFNVIGDLVLVAAFKMGSAGAAIATVAAQGLSVIISFILICKRELPIEFTRRSIRFDFEVIGAELKIGVPVAVQNILSQLSFLIIQMIINGISVVASAAAGIGDKTGGFLLLLPVAYMHAMASFVAQNMGAGKPERAKAALKYSILISVAIGLVMTCISIAHGDFLAGFFTKDAEVISAAHSYIASAYGFDCILTAVVFCFVGYYNGCGKTMFVLAQGLFGAFAVRVPFAVFASKLSNAGLFLIGLSTPISSAVQMLLCLVAFRFLETYSKKHSETTALSAE